MNILKKLTLTATLASCLGAFAQDLHKQQLLASHGGGNGGDDLEMELRKKSLQIGYFIKSSTGSQVFKSLNPDAVLESIEKTDIDVVAQDVLDKYGTIRTCINEPARALITCNLARINQLKKDKQDDILTAMLFHEILGIMELELGHQENVSLYPVSSKIIPYHSIVISTPVAEAQIRPEYYGKDSRSYGITLENKDTKESVRMICLNDHVEVHRCRNYSVVRKAGDFQAPLVPKIISLDPSDLSAITKVNVTGSAYEMKKKNENAWKLTTQVLNLSTNLSLIGKSESVKNADYELVLNYLIKAILEKDAIPMRQEQAERNRIAQEEQRKKNEEAARIAAAKKEEQDKIKAEEDKRNAIYNRKDGEQITQIGKFSMTFKKDFVMLANKTEHVVYINNSMWDGEKYKVLSCRFIFPSKSEVDRLVPEGTKLDIDMSKPVKPEMKVEDMTTIAAPTLTNGKITLQFECRTNSDRLGNMTIGTWKSYFKDYALMTLADPEQIK